MRKKVSRPNKKMPGDAKIATKDAILEAAIRHFAAYGYEGAHVRQMLADAGVNMALAHYHFGSKETLFEAVLDSFLEPVVAERQNLLRDWISIGGDTNERLGELLTAYVLPHFRVSATAGGHHYASLMQRVLSSGNRIDNASIRAVHALRQEYISHLQQLIPNLSLEDAEFTMNALVAVMLAESRAMSGQLNVSPKDAEVHSRRVARLIAGGLYALIDD